MRKKVNFVIMTLCFLVAFVAIYAVIDIPDYWKYKRAELKTEMSYKKNDSNVGQVTFRWDYVRDAISYNIYYSKSPGVTKKNGRKISTVTNSAIIQDLKSGTTYYFVVTAVNKSGESDESKEISYTVK